jgi:hypothetical protein
VNDLTAYFITTDRLHAGPSLASLRAQGLARAPVVVRNVRPMRVAYATTLGCPTSYAFLLDDDVILRRGVVPRLLEEFRVWRRAHPDAFWICPATVDELSGRTTSCGIHLFHAPLLRQVGFPDGPHLSYAQRERAEAMGLSWLRSSLVMGVHHAGRPRDVYQRYLWLQIRAASGQGRYPDLETLVQRAVTGDGALPWMACLGVLDGRVIGDVPSSKNETLLGREGAALDFDNLALDRIRARVTELYARIAARGLPRGTIHPPAEPPARELDERALRDRRG